jgi:DNA-3-methyladenine glycosylase I
MRCEWAPDGLMAEYHDTEWGRPIFDDQQLFEMLTLEGAQAGLSWDTVLKRREGYRRCFLGFDIEKVSKLTPKDVDDILLDEGVIRHRGKIESTITNAQAVQLMAKQHDSFAKFLWSFVDFKPIIAKVDSLKQIPAETAESKAMSKALKKAGFKFCGPTICYAFMQAAGMVNDHVRGCPQRQECLDAWESAQRPF